MITTRLMTRTWLAGRLPLRSSAIFFRCLSPGLGDSIRRPWSYATIRFLDTDALFVPAEREHLPQGAREAQPVGVVSLNRRDRSG